MFQRILVPLDGSTRAEQALPVAARLAHASSETIVLLRVVNLPNQFVSYVALEPGATQTVINTQLEEAKNYLEYLTRSNDLINAGAACHQASALDRASARGGHKRALERKKEHA